MSEEVARYVVAVVRRTRELPTVELGASPRAAVHLLAAARAAARLAGRDYVTPDDVARMAPPVLRHRLVLTPGGRARALRPGRRRADRARRGAGAAVSPSPRAAAGAGGVALSPSLVGWAVGLLAGVAVAAATVVDALAVRARPRSSAGSRRSSPAACPPLVVAAAPAGAGRPGAPADPARPRARATRGRRPARLPPHAGGAAATCSAPAARAGARSGSAAGTTPARERGSCSSTPTCLPRGGWRSQSGRGVPRDGPATRGPLGLGTDFESVRDYQPDDDVRQVNWRASARIGRPISDQYRIEQDREVHAASSTPAA